MNCEMFQEQIVPYLEGALDEASANELQNHLANCPACQAEAQAYRALHERLTTAGHTETAVATNLSQTVMDQILLQQVLLTRRLIMRRRIRIFGVSGLAVLFIGLIWTTLQHGPTTALAAEPLARGVEAASNLNTIHLKVRMRTPPADNFESIDLSADFVDVDLWQQFSPLKWRVEKPGRVVVMDGKQAVMLLGTGKERLGYKLDIAAEPGAFDTGFLQRLAAVDQVLAKELAAITARGYDVKVEHPAGADGAPKDVVTIQVNTDDKVSSYLKNKFLGESDSSRVYTFDPNTHRLENAKFYYRDKGKEVLALELVKIEYDPAIDDSLFSLPDAENVSWIQKPERLKDNRKYEEMTPAEVARAMFQACADRNWDEAANFVGFKFDDRLKEAFGGLTIISIGEPFQAKPYPGWFVPYEIRLANGAHKKFNLAVRNDNAAKRYIVDGGF